MNHRQKLVLSIIRGKKQPFLNMNKQIKRIENMHGKKKGLTYNKF